MAVIILPIKAKKDESLILKFKKLVKIKSINFDMENTVFKFEINYSVLG